MFASLSRFRRQIAVLTALAMVASVLVAVPAVAADPKMDYKATFDACMGVPSAGFEDVSANRANAGDIDCIAYYGITKGTSATTYSPDMSVTREHMALFLTRLAGLVGIDLASDPDDAGFTDIGDLSAESQTAINQLADLDITQGTGGGNYSPGDSVKRGHMALFIARLMNHMDPMAEGTSETDPVYGYTPEDVKDVPDGDDDDDLPDKTVKSPFTDISGTTKEAYDAITALWELDVASGISDTSYAPDANITRAAMAEFMAGVLDHSNARPAGVTIQATKTSDFGGFSPTVAVSYRDDDFAPMVDVSIKVFHSGDDGAGETGVGEFNEDGGCSMASDCAWTDDESLTDASGNIYVSAGVTDGKSNTYYAWMGDPDEDENDFDVDTSPHASVTLSSTTDATALKVTTDINENSTNKNTVDIDATSSVTLTAQLVDDDGDPVAKSGVEVKISVKQGLNDLYPAPAAMKTDDDGQVTYTTSGPKSTKGNTDDDRVDIVTFSSDVDGDDTTDNTVADLATDGSVAVGGNDETVDATIFWTDSDPTLVTIDAVAGQTREAQGSGKGSTDPYAILSGQGKVTIRASVSFYDQYGNPIGKGNKVAIDIGAADSATRTVSSRGVASWRVTNDLSSETDGGLGATQTVEYALRNAADDAALTGAPTIADTTVVAVRHADDDSSADAADITAVYAKEDRFRIGGALYSYDDDDVFITDAGDDADGKVLDLAGFEKEIGGNLSTITSAANIEIVAYDDDGSSIFRVVTAAS